MKLERHLEIAQHGMALYDIAPFSDSQFFSAGADKVAVLWDLKTGEQLPTVIKTENSIYSIAFQLPNLLSIGLSNGDIHWIDTETKQEIKCFQTKNQGVFSQLVLKQSNLLLTGNASGELMVWDLNDQSLQLTIPLDCGKIRGIEKSIDEKKIAVSAQDGKIRVFETNFFNAENEFFAHKDGANVSRFLPNDQNVLITGGKDGYLRIWNTLTNEKLEAIPAHNYAVYDIAFSPDGSHFATCSRDKSIKLWNTNSLKVVQKITAKEGGHRHSVNKLIWIDNQLISCGDDKRILIWNVKL